MRTRRGVAVTRRTLFIDRSIGRAIAPAALRARGECVECHDDHLVPDAPDPDWIRLVAERDWIGVTRDERLEYAHREIVETAGARIFLVRSGGAMSGVELARVLVDAIDFIHRLDAKYAAPFIARVSPAGKVAMPDRYENRRRNPRPKRRR